MDDPLAHLTTRMRVTLQVLIALMSIVSPTAVVYLAMLAEVR